MTTKTMEYLLRFGAEGISQTSADVQALQSKVVGFHQEVQKLESQSVQGGLGGLTTSAANTNKALFETQNASAAARGGLSDFAAAAPRTATALSGVEASAKAVAGSVRAQAAAIGEAHTAGEEWKAYLESLRAQYNPIFAVSRQYEQQLKRIADAEDLGAISAQEAVQARTRAAAMLAPATQGMTAYGTATKLTAWEQRNLMYQVNDTVQSIALGMPISQVALQQGPQIMQIYGGVGNTFRALRAAATPARLALGATAGAALLGVASYDKYLKSVKAVETAAAGLGRRTAGSMAEMEQAAQLGANAAGISVQSARAMEAQFLQTGAIGAEHFEDLIALSKDFATTMGIAADEAGSALSDMFSDPAKAAETLNQKYGLIDGATARLASTLAAQNRQSEAQGVLLDALPERLAKAETAMTGWQRVRSKVGPVLSDVGDGIGRALDETFFGGREPTPEEMLNTGRLNEDTINRMLKSWNPGTRATGMELAAERSMYEHQIITRDAQAAEEKARQEAEAKGNTAFGIANASPASATDRRISDLRNQIAALEAGQHPDNGLDETQNARIAEAIEAKAAALAALETRQTRTLELDRLDIAMAQARNPLLQAELAERKRLLELAGQELSQSERLSTAARTRARVLSQAVATSDQAAATMRQETQIRTILTGAVSAGLLPLSRLEDQIQKELTLRPLIEAAAAAEGAEREALTQTLMEQEAAYEALLKSKRDMAAQTEVSGGQDEIARLRLEQSLIGQNGRLREHAIAQLEAELKIRDLGVHAASDMADAIRRQAAEQANLTAELRRQSEAWNSVQSAGESAIDGVFDSLADGDTAGALQGIADEVQGVLLELAVKNPAKNRILGTDFETLGDIGGLQGVWQRLLSGPDQSVQSRLLAQNAAAMSVTTPMVTINAGAINGPSGFLGGASGSGGHGLSGPEGVQRQVWDYFSGKGLAPHQVAAIVGNVSAESAFNPHAVGDGGTSFGLFQHHAGRGQGLLSHVGGQAGLGNVQGQLDYVWKELLGSESRVLDRLMSSQNLYEANSAFIGFERPQGWSPANPQGGLGWDHRLGAAEAALTKFANTTESTALGLGTLGDGFGAFGQMLSQVQVGGGGGESSLLGSLIKIGGSLLGLPGFMGGGDTGGNDPTRIAGFVHQKEYVFDAASTARIGVSNLDAIRRGGNASPATAPAPILLQPAANNIVVKNYEGAKITTEETTDSQGGRQTILRVGEVVGLAVSQSGNPANKSLQQAFSLKRKGVKRQ